MNDLQIPILDLQLFAEEKTEKATPKRRREAREKGQVVKSVEVGTAVSILASFYMMKFVASIIIGNLKSIYRDFLYIEMPLDSIFTYPNLRKILIETITKMSIAILPVLGSGLVVGLVINYAQVGFLFVTEPLKPDLSRINPIQGFKRLFSRRTLYELLKSLLKLSIIIGVVYDILLESLRAMPMLLRMQISSGFIYICNQVFRIAIKSGIALLAMAVFDYAYQWWDHERNLRMTKKEIEEEHKQMEGDPQVKGRIREVQRQISMSRMMQEIPQADVVIVNPTHFAVALAYDPNKDDAPFVLAKGQGYIALNIKKRAKEYSIAVVEDKSLAQALFNTSEIGQIIPPELYQAVAEVLAYVYSLRDED